MSYDNDNAPSEDLFVLIEYGPSFSTIHFPDPRMPMDFQQAFTVTNPDYRPEYLDPMNPVPEFVEFFDSENNFIYTGLVYAAVDWCQKRGIDVKLEGFPFDMWKGDEPPEIPIDLIPGILLRGYQQDAIAACVARWRGVVEVATGSGKTEVAIGLILHLNNPKTVFVCPDAASQAGMYSRFVQRGFEPMSDVGLYGDNSDHLDEDPSVLISTIQSLYSGVKRNDRRVLERLQSCELFIVDEVHHKATAFSWKAVGAMCHAHRRIGLSATPYKSDNSRKNPTYLHGHDSWITGLVGDTIYYLPAKDLQKSGALQRCEVVSFEAARTRVFSDRWHDVYQHGIVDNIGRNNQIALIATNLVDMGRRPLISVEKLNHGRQIQKILYYAYGIPSACSYGQGVTYLPEDVAAKEGLAYEGIPVYDRPPKSKGKTKPKIVGYEKDFVQVPDDTNVRDLVERRVINVLIGSRIYDESQDIPVLTDLINAAGGKAAQRFRQKVGRVLRLDGTNSVSWIWEPWDSCHHYLKNHSKKRLQVAQEQGFPVVADWSFARIFHTHRLKDLTCKEVDMKYDKLTVRTEMTIPMGNYSSIRPGVSLTATLEEGDDPITCSDQLAAITLAAFYREAWRQGQNLGAMQTHSPMVQIEAWLTSYAQANQGGQSEISS